MLQHGLHDLDGGQNAVAGVGVLAENDVAGLLAADEVAVGPHVFVDVFVAHVGLFIVDPQRIQGLVQAEVGHDGGNDGVVGQLLPLLHVRAVQIEDAVAVHQVALLVHGQAAVGVAVKGEADVHVGWP